MDGSVLMWRARACCEDRCWTTAGGQPLVDNRWRPLGTYTKPGSGSQNRVHCSDPCLGDMGGQNARVFQLCGIIALSRVL